MINDTKSDIDWSGYKHNNGGTEIGYYSSPFFEIDVGIEKPFIMALEMFNAETGKINRQPFGIGMICIGRIANWMERDKTGKFKGKAKEIEIWK